MYYVTSGYVKVDCGFEAQLRHYHPLMQNLCNVLHKPHMSQNSFWVGSPFGWDECPLLNLSTVPCAPGIYHNWLWVWNSVSGQPLFRTCTTWSLIPRYIQINGGLESLGVHNPWYKPGERTTLTWHTYNLIVGWKAMSVTTTPCLEPTTDTMSHTPSTPPTQSM